MPTDEARTAGHRRRAIASLGLANAAGLVLAVTGALNTGETGFGTRLLFWAIVMNAGAMIGLGVAPAIKEWGRLARWKWAEGSLIAVLLALPQSLVVIAARSLVFGLPVPSPSGCLWLFGFVLFITAVMVALDYALGEPRQETVTTTVTPPADAHAETALERFRQRLPHGYRTATIRALEAEDHYLRVHTDSGSALILMRLADALVEIAGIEGAQTHRSWWVARSAVASAKRGAGRATLILQDGLEVPVSRSFYKAVSGLGWLD